MRRFLEGARESPCTYRGDPEPGSRFARDHHRVRLGSGAGVLERARDALRSWSMFELGWIRVHDRTTPIEEGRDVAVLARVLGVWFWNACRIARVVDEGSERFGFTYRTLRAHAECGEETFLVERDGSDGSVWYDLRAISRPNHPLVALARPLARALQRRFARDSLAAMSRAVSRGAG